jgi:ATP-dependent RNA helicase DDX10/DBP4
MDCPESPETYIHRVGRTARYRSKGHALLFLAPSELAMIDALKAAKVPIKRVKADEEKMRSTAEHFRGFLAEDPDLKYLAQKAFVSYLRSVYLQSNKKVFNVHELPVADIADRMGLAGTPRVKFLQQAGGKKGAAASANSNDGDEVSDSDDEKNDNKDANGAAEQSGSMNAAKNMPHALREMLKQDELKKKRKEAKLKAARAAAAAAEAAGEDAEEAADEAIAAVERKQKGATKKLTGERGTADIEEYFDEEAEAKAARRKGGRGLAADVQRILKRQNRTVIFFSFILFLFSLVGHSLHNSSINGIA